MVTSAQLLMSWLFSSQDDGGELTFSSVHEVQNFWLEWLWWEQGVNAYSDIQSVGAEAHEG